MEVRKFVNISRSGPDSSSLSALSLILPNSTGLRGTWGYAGLKGPKFPAKGKRPVASHMNTLRTLRSLGRLDVEFKKGRKKILQPLGGKS